MSTRTEKGQYILLIRRRAYPLQANRFPLKTRLRVFSEYRIEQMKERRKGEEYKIKVKMFKALKKAAKVKEECEVLLKGREKNAGSGD